MSGEIRKAIKELATFKGEMYSVVCEVLSVDKMANTIDARPQNGTADLRDVRLHADFSKAEGIVIYPQKGSFVIVSFLDKHNAFVSLYSEIESIHFKAYGQELNWDQNGLHLKSSTTDFTSEMNRLIDLMDGIIAILMKFQLNTSQGPTIAVMPNLVVELGKKKAELAKVKTAINTTIQ